MKISFKIMILAAFLLLILALDGLVSHQLLSRMGGELQGVVDQDVVLMQNATTITRHQLQKAIIFERVRRIAEELAYQQTTPARKEHLLFHTKLAQGGFDDLAKDGALSIVSGKLLVSESLKSVRDKKSREDIKKLEDVLKEIEKAHIHYDALVGEVFNAITSGNYELSMDDLNQIHRDEKKLSTELQNLLDAVQLFTQESLKKARAYERTAEKILGTTLILSLLAAMGLAFSIIRSITVPLQALGSASARIGAGDLDVRLEDKSRDEFGKVSRAFNDMSRQLKESKQKLEAQSETLRKNLELTGQQKKDLEKVNHELDRFVHTVSHDIRSPLMGIAWYADYLKKQYYEQFDQKGRNSLDGVCRGVDRANALISDLLALTRITRIRNPYQVVRVASMVDEVVANLEYRIKQNRVDLKIQSDLPTVVCDGIKIKEVFLNLLTNAIKFSSGTADVQPVVEIAYVEKADTHEFIVRDNGIGIAPEHHEDIFDMFKRVDNSGKYEGTGAGLSIVKNIVEDHGGAIWVESGLGHGAAFHFSIPKGLQVQRPVDGDTLS
ncbi:MAG: HAMP domain-containing protein [Candidatus Omnitrophica bacterium]|nr:HAMP domain-containing protein [Candidatus Omnitrophota bacterium]